MNKEYLQKNVGKLVRITPTPIHVSDSGAHVQRDDDWKVLGYTGRIVTVQHVTTSAQAAFDDDNYGEYRGDAPRGPDFGVLMLNGQLVVRGGVGTIHPLRRGEHYSATPTSLVAEAYLEASLDCHKWKIDFVTLLGLHRVAHNPRAPGADIWDVMDGAVPDYSPELYAHCRPLFNTSVDVLVRRFDRLIQNFGRVLPEDFQVELVRAQRQLSVEQFAYRTLPELVQHIPGVDAQSMFRGRFLSVIALLKSIARRADDARADLVPSTGRGGKPRRRRKTLKR